MALPNAPYTDVSSGLDYFKSHFISKNGLSRPTRYSVLIEADAFTPGHAIFQPETVSLPGRTFRTLQENWFGPTRKIPVAREFNSEVIMTFPLSRNWEERTLFEAWMDSLINPETNETHYSDNGQTVKGNMTVFCIDEINETQAIFKFDEVWPSSIIPMNMGFNMINDYNKLQIIFTYRQYTYKSENYQTPTFK